MARESGAAAAVEAGRRLLESRLPFWSRQRVKTSQGEVIKMRCPKVDCGEVLYVEHLSERPTMACPFCMRPSRIDDDWE